MHLKAQPVTATANGISAQLKSKLWTAADKLRGHMDAAEYKHVVLSLIFLKYISDAFETLLAMPRDTTYDDPEDPSEYIAESIFWMLQKALGITASSVNRDALSRLMIGQIEI